MAWDGSLTEQLIYPHQASKKPLVTESFKNIISWNISEKKCVGQSVNIIHLCLLFVEFLCVYSNIILCLRLLPLLITSSAHSFIINLMLTNFSPSNLISRTNQMLSRRLLPPPRRFVDAKPLRTTPRAVSSCELEQLVRKQNKQKSSGSQTVFIHYTAFGLGTMIYTGLELGAFFEIPFTSPCHQILRGVNPLLQMIFTFMQMYFIFMNARVSDKEL